VKSIFCFVFKGPTLEVKIKLNSRRDYLLTKQNQTFETFVLSSHAYTWLRD